MPLKVTQVGGGGARLFISNTELKLSYIFCFISSCFRRRCIVSIWAFTQFESSSLYSPFERNLRSKNRWFENGFWNVAVIYKKYGRHGASLPRWTQQSDLRFAVLPLNLKINIPINCFKLSRLSWSYANWWIVFRAEVWRPSYPQ